MAGAERSGLQRGQDAVVHLDDGFDFLGFNVRRYQGKLLIKPSKAAVQRHRKRLAAEMLALRGANAKAVTARLNPIIRGWSAYYRGVVSSEEFSTLDNYVWKLTYKWAKYSHPNKSKHWVVNRYFGRSTGPDGTGGSSATVTAAPTCSSTPGPRLSGTSWCQARRLLTTRTLAEYWARRRQRKTPPLDGVSLRLLKRSTVAVHSVMHLLLLADHEPQSPEEWEQWLMVTRKAVRRDAITAEQDLARRTNPLPSISCTPTVDGDRHTAVDT
jgi:RNA-directed DNA polymerase